MTTWCWLAKASPYQSPRVEFWIFILHRNPLKREHGYHQAPPATPRPPVPSLAVTRGKRSGVYVFLEELVHSKHVPKVGVRFQGGDYSGPRWFAPAVRPSGRAPTPPSSPDLCQGARRWCAGLWGGIYSGLFGRVLPSTKAGAPPRPRLDYVNF